MAERGRAATVFLAELYPHALSSHEKSLQKNMIAFEQKTDGKIRHSEKATIKFDPKNILLPVDAYKYVVTCSSPPRTFLHTVT